MTNNQIAPLWEWLPQESASELKSLALDWRKIIYLYFYMKDIQINIQINYLRK